MSFNDNDNQITSLAVRASVYTKVIHQQPQIPFKLKSPDDQLNRPLNAKMKRKCFAIASLIFTLPKVVCSQVDQKYHHEGVAEDPSDQLHTDHYYYEEYEEEVEVETLEYEEVFEFSSEDYEDDEEFEEVKNDVQVDGNCHDDHERCAFWASLGKRPNTLQRLLLVPR